MDEDTYVEENPQQLDNSKTVLKSITQHTVDTEYCCPQPRRQSGLLNKSMAFCLVHITDSFHPNWLKIVQHVDLFVTQIERLKKQAKILNHCFAQRGYTTKTSQDKSKFTLPQDTALYKKNYTQLGSHDE